MLAKLSLLTLAAGTILASTSASAVVIDFSRNNGNDFENGTNTATQPVDPGDPTRTITVIGSTLGATGRLRSQSFPFGNGTSFGVQTSDLPTADEDSRISGQDALLFSFNFAGVLDGADFTGLVNDTEARLQKTRGLSVTSRTFINETFYNNSTPPADVILVDRASASVDGLSELDDDFFTFAPGDVFTFTSESFFPNQSPFVSFGLETLTVLVPSPGAGTALLGVVGLLCMTRRRTA